MEHRVSHLIHRYDLFVNTLEFKGMPRAFY